jgi:hypothetical protein
MGDIMVQGGVKIVTALETLADFALPFKGGGGCGCWVIHDWVAAILS